MALLLGAGGCTRLPPVRMAECVDAETGDAPAVVSADGRSSVTLDVLTFNIEGLGWPARRGRSASLRRIGAILSDLNARGEAPDIVLVQEMFSQAAVRAMAGAGYHYRAWGPSRTQRKRMAADDRVPPPFRWRKGETGLHLVGSGLAVLSRYPIVARESEPFGKHRCAGFDCLSNKGVQHARVVVPGVPQPIELFNTHLNSQGASRVPRERHGAAHALQIRDLAAFVSATTTPGAPTIFGGDFNMRGARRRMARFEQVMQDFDLVHRYCMQPGATCTVRMSWDGDEPWMDTEDLQLFRSGSTVQVVPTVVEAMFDSAATGAQLSDHDGFRVKYRLSWPTTAQHDAPPPTSCHRPSAAR